MCHEEIFPLYFLEDFAARMEIASGFSGYMSIYGNNSPKQFPIWQYLAPWRAGRKKMSCRQAKKAFA